MLFDSHCHIHDSKFDADRAETIARALDVLEGIVVIGTDLEDSRAAIALTGDRVYATVGFHPYEAEKVDAAALEELRALAAQPGVVALGEIGLDYFNEFAPRAAQKLAFPAQLALAAGLGLPAVIHCRNAEEDTLAILRDHIAALPDCIMHCFGGDAAFAEDCVALGCHVSFAGNLTYPKALPLREAAALVPWDRLLIETDAPYLTPQPRRGQRCEPAFLPFTAETLAKVKGVDLETVERYTTANARRVFRIGQPGQKNHN